MGTLRTRFFVNAPHAPGCGAWAGVPAPYQAPCFPVIYIDALSTKKVAAFENFSLAGVVDPFALFYCVWQSTGQIAR